MWKVINEFLVSVDDFVWGIPLMVLILAGGILLTARLGLLADASPPTGTEVDVQK